jgi:histidine kinase
MPILLKNKLEWVIHLENNLCEGLFTKRRSELLGVLTSQMAITLENMRFFNAQMEVQFEKIRLEKLAHDSTEKYKTQLENFMDMICHEIRNPYVY